MAVLIVRRRMELFSRRNFLMKRTIAESSKELYNLNCRNQHLLRSLLPNRIVERCARETLRRCRRFGGPPVLTAACYPFVRPGGEGRLEKEPGRVIADKLEHVGVLFCTITNFSVYDTEHMTILNHVVTRLDNLARLYNVEKIKLIGMRQHDSTRPRGRRRCETLTSGGRVPPPAPPPHSGTTYMAISGACGNTPNHLQRLADFALATSDVVKWVNERYNKTYGLRMGMDVGPAVAGVIGRSKVRVASVGEARPLSPQLTLCFQATRGRLGLRSLPTTFGAGRSTWRRAWCVLGMRTKHPVVTRRRLTKRCPPWSKRWATPGEHRHGGPHSGDQGGARRAAGRVPAGAAGPGVCQGRGHPNHLLFAAPPPHQREATAGAHPRRVLAQSHRCLQRIISKELENFDRKS